MARIRNTEYETVHHLTSRIAHRVFFLKEEERNDFLDLVFRVSEFSGVELLGWCIMNNHFHLYVYLPTPPMFSDEEVLQRFACLKGDADRLLSDEDDDRIVNPYAECQGETGAECQAPRASLRGCIEARKTLVKSIRRRMYSIAEYMRMIKKWFSDAYNERNGHKGTMWEAVYGDRHCFKPESEKGYVDIRDRLAYINLNPVRAAITDRFDGYPWSSYAAWRKGDSRAVEAMHRVYPGYSDEEIVAVHEERMARLLEDWKLKRAKEIALKRLSGYAIPADALTEECMIAQAEEQIRRVQKEVADMQLKRAVAKKTSEVRALVCRQIVALMGVVPDSTPKMLSETLKVPLRTVQRYLACLVRDGVLTKDSDGLNLSVAA